MEKERDKSLKRVLAFLGHISTLQTVWQLVAASGFASLALSMMPGGWHQPQYWFSGFFAFFLAWGMVGTAVAGVRKCYPRLKRWRNPPKLEVTFESGEIGTATLRHMGEPATYTADARIVEVLGGPENPAPQLFQCPLWLHGCTESITSAGCRQLFLPAKG